MLCAAADWDGKHSEWGEPSFRSVERRQGDRVPLASTPVPAGAANGVSRTRSHRKFTVFRQIRETPPIFFANS